MMHYVLYCPLKSQEYSFQASQEITRKNDKVWKTETVSRVCSTSIESHNSRKPRNENEGRTKRWHDSTETRTIQEPCCEWVIFQRTKLRQFSFRVPKRAENSKKEIKTGKAITDTPIFTGRESGLNEKPKTGYKIASKNGLKNTRLLDSLHNRSKKQQLTRTTKKCLTYQIAACSAHFAKDSKGGCLTSPQL